jgi:glycerophosphoryl diester phosphodiesterase
MTPVGFVSSASIVRDWDVVVVAHRGMVAGFPENTLAAYRQAIVMGFSAIEIDLRATADGHIVVMHDDTVDRTTSGCGEVSKLMLADIRSLDAGSHAGPEFADQKVPTFEEVLETVRGSGVKLVLDIKPGPLLDHRRIVRLTEQYGAILDVIIGPRSLSDLHDFKRLNPNLRTLGLVPGEEFTRPDHDAVEEFARSGADIIRLWPPWIFTDRDQSPGGETSDLVERMHQLGKPVWTTADVLYRDINPERPRDDLAELVRLGVNGILTDVPELLRDLLAAPTAVTGRCATNPVRWDTAPT